MSRIIDWHGGELDVKKQGARLPVYVRRKSQSGQLIQKCFFGFVNRAFTVDFNIFETFFLSQVLVKIRRGQGSIVRVVVDVMPFVDGGFVLIIGAGF